MEDHIKQKILILAALVIIVFVGFWIYDSQESKSVESQAALHPCAINFLSTFVENATTTNKETIATTLIDQLLSAYEQIPNCPALGISDYSVTSVGNIKNVQGDFTADTVFNILPISKSQTAWTTARDYVERRLDRRQRNTFGHSYDDIRHVHFVLARRTGKSLIVDLRGIEPLPHPCHGCVIPFYYRPSEEKSYIIFLLFGKLKTFGLPGVEPGPHPPHGRILPLYYSPSRV